MRVEAKIQKWGNGLALRISGVLRDIPHFREGMIVDVDVTEEGLTIKKPTSKHEFLPFTEVELLHDLTPSSIHAELLTDPLANEFAQS